MDTKTVLETQKISLLNLASVVILPGMSLPIIVTQEKQIRAFEHAWKNNVKILAVTPERPVEQEAIGCVIEVIAFHFDNNHNAIVVIRGVSRSRVLSNGDADAVVEEIYRISNQAARRGQRERLLATFERRFPFITENHMLTPALVYDLPFGKLCDLLAASCKLNEDHYSHLLQEVDVDQRSEILLDILMNEQPTEVGSKDVPEFSIN